MATAKRLYLYVVSAVGLAMLLFGGGDMLRLLLVKLGVGPHPFSSPSVSTADKETLAMALAIGVIGLALWATHWLFVERMVRGESDPAVAERRSVIRSVYYALWLYFSIVAAGLLAAANLARVVRDLTEPATGDFGSLFSINPFASLDDATALAIILPLAFAWALHAWARGRDVRQGPAIRGAAAWVSRIALYFTAWYAVEQIAGTVGAYGNYILLGLTTSIGGSQYLGELLSTLAILAIWTPILLGYWIYSNRLRSGDGEQAQNERASRVRAAFFMLIVLDAAITLATQFSTSLSALLLWAFDLRIGDPFSVWYEVLAPVLTAAPWLVALWWARRRAFFEAPVGPAGVSPWRVSGYIAALVGVAVLAFGLVEALAAILGQVLSKSPNYDYGSLAGGLGGMWKVTVLSGIAMALVGLGLWVWAWVPARSRRHASWAAETGSSSRGWYLYSVAGAAMVILAVAAAMLLLPTLRRIFGLQIADFGAEIATPLAFVLVAGGLVATHLWTLRGDATPPVPPAWPGMPYPGYPGQPWPPMPGQPGGWPPAGQPPQGWPQPPQGWPQPPQGWPQPPQGWPQPPSGAPAPDATAAEPEPAAKTDEPARS